MTDSLDGIRLKRERAWSQLHALKPEITAFLDSDPYVPRVKLYGQSEQLVIWVDIKSEVDPMWSIKIGEMVHNLRCCFDYLVRELYILKNRQVPPPRIQFPIFMSESRFVREGVRKFLPGFDQTDIDMIRSEQPFSKKDGGTGEGSKSPLWHLHELSNADKHRTLQLTGTLIQEYRLSFPEASREFSYYDLERMKPGPIKKNTTLWRGRLIGVKEWPFSDGEINGALSVNVAFDQGVPEVGGWNVCSTLADIANRTDRILNRFFKSVWDTEL